LYGRSRVGRPRHPARNFEQPCSPSRPPPGNEAWLIRTPSPRRSFSPPLGEMSDQTACRLCGRESIFSVSHTKTLQNYHKVAHEPGVAWGARNRGRWSYERGAAAAAAGLGNEGRPARRGLGPRYRCKKALPTAGGAPLALGRPVRLAAEPRRKALKSLSRCTITSQQSLRALPGWNPRAPAATAFAQWMLSPGERRTDAHSRGRPSETTLWRDPGGRSGGFCRCLAPGLRSLQRIPEGSPALWLTATACGRPPLGGPRVTLRPLGRVRRRAPWGPWRGKADCLERRPRPGRGCCSRAHRCRPLPTGPAARGADR